MSIVAVGKNGVIGEIIDIRMSDTDVDKAFRNCIKTGSAWNVSMLAVMRAENILDTGKPDRDDFAKGDKGDVEFNSATETYRVAALLIDRLNRTETKDAVKHEESLWRYETKDDHLSLSINQQKRLRRLDIAIATEGDEETRLTFLKERTVLRADIRKAQNID